ncbi:MAG: hypothetical protein ABIE43_04490 [Patescibacteria group bacterium]
MFYKIASLMLNLGKTSDSTGEVFISQPDANKESLGGRLFILIEINSKKSQALKIINFLTNNLNYNYYQNEKIILRERINSLRVEHIFETTIAKTNKEFIEFMSREKIKINRKSLNITAGIIHENNLYFSNSGNNKALLIFKEKEQKRKSQINKNNNESNYKIVKIGDSKLEDSRHNASENKINKGVNNYSEAKQLINQNNFKKIFSDVISGSLPTNGYFLLTNEALLEYLSNKQLIEIVTNLPPTSASEQIKNLLNKVNTYIPFLSILIKNTVGLDLVSQENKVIKDITSTPKDSISGLNNAEDETERLLAPSGVINFKKWAGVSGRLFKLGLNKLYSLFYRPTDNLNNAKKEYFLKDKIFFKKKPSLLSVNRIFLLIKTILFFLINLIFYFFKIITSKKKLKEALGEFILLLVAIRNKFKSIKNWFYRLSKKSKILLSISSLCLVIFIINLVVINAKNNNIKERLILDNTIKIIEQKQNQIDANLLYDNEDGAIKILKEAEELYVKLPQETEEQIEIYNNLLKKHEAQLEKIRHVVKLENINEIGDFFNLNSHAEISNIALLNNTIYASDKTQKTIYILNIEKNLITAITDIEKPIISLLYPSEDKNGNIYYLNNSSIIRLDSTAKELFNVSINLGVESTKITAMASFNNRLYLVDSNNNQIYRFNKLGNNFGEKENWIKEKTDLSQAVSLSIDGQIYVLNKNGEVLKYLKGQAENFELDLIEPNFENPTKIKVSQELEFIYILEPVNKRLAIFDKTGDFIMQYKSDNFNDLKDFIVDEKTKMIYFLNKTSVYEVEGTHFKN